jgi:hypothetical protein
MSNLRILALAVLTYVVVSVSSTGFGSRPAGADPTGEGVVTFRNGAGHVSTLNVNGEIDTTNPFFQDLGSNGRTCVTCHQPAEGWSITPDGVQARFARSGGMDEIFRSNDGSNCEAAVPGSMADMREAYSLLLTRGLIRVGLDVPAGAEFTIEDVADPYGCPLGSNDVSVYRRPLPTANLRFLSAVMWDGRESLATSTIHEDLSRQANGATRGHAAAVRDLTAEEVEQIVAFEMGLYTAQSRDNQAGGLGAQHGKGGPEPVAVEPFFLGINDPIGLNPSGAPFEAKAFTLFDAWMTVPQQADTRVAEGRRAIARGQALFNSKPIELSGVSGLNGETFANGVTLPASFSGTCTVCHDAPNVGNHSVKAPLDIGLTSPAVAPYLPVYTLRNITTGEMVETTDPGRALITGRWSDLNRFKGPILRGLASRAPYFHNGAAATLEDVVEFYDTRFNIGLAVHEKADLVAFLKAL